MLFHLHAALTLQWFSMKPTIFRCTKYTPHRVRHLHHLFLPYMKRFECSRSFLRVGSIDTTWPNASTYPRECCGFSVFALYLPVVNDRGIAATALVQYPVHTTHLISFVETILRAAVLSFYEPRVFFYKSCVCLKSSLAMCLY